MSLEYNSSLREWFALILAGLMEHQHRTDAFEETFESVN